HEAHSRSGQRGARGDRRRGRALPGTGGAAARRCRARRVVSLSEGAGPPAARLPTVLRALQRTDDTARVGVDRGYARGPCDAHRREHPADRARGAPAEPDSLTGLPLVALFIFRSSRPAGPQPGDGLRLALPFFYGWGIVAVGFVTMAIGVSARTAFSLLFPPILDEVGWGRGVAAGAVSLGFFVSALLSPLVGRLMDRRGPRIVIEMGVIAMAAGLMLAPVAHRPWHLYVTLGALVGGGGNCLGYTGQSLFLPNWFVRRRG